MKISLCSHGDFYEILNTLSEFFWGDDRRRHHYHPFLYYEFGDTAFVMKNDND